ncbi:hypothetical protein BDV93DRAFT_524777 [Ceratobasidium sp. AG-I]|nr:hypothetical protein BDV93DRAFT_524777 [Ceratobasidium sp. AG-I]
MLGLFALLRALESEHLLESDSHPIFDLLWDRPFEEETRPELPSVNLGNIDLTRQVVETAFDCHQCLAKRNIENWHLDMAIADMLKRVHKPWATPIATALLECPASDILRNGCVYYIAQNEPGVTGAGAALLSNAIYEATRLQPRYHRLDEDDLLRLTLHFESVSVHGERDVHTVVHALLRRLLHEDMFGDLVILIARARSTGVLRQWRGIKAGYVVQFWGEHIIQLGRSMHQESGSNPVAEKLQGLFASGEEPTDWIGTVLEGTMEISNMLWQEIEKPEDSPVTPESRVSRWTRLIWRSQRAESPPGQSV